MIDKLTDTWTADSEAVSERDGYMSYRAEWHSAAFGFAVFFLATLTGRVELIGLVLAWAIRGTSDRKKTLNIPYPQQLRHESAYLVGHGVAGTLLALPVRLALGSPIFPTDLLGAFL